MAGYGSDDGAANNGFGRRSLHQWEGRLLYAAGYPAPPDFRPPGGWRLLADLVPVANSMPLRPRPRRELHADGRVARLVQAGLGEGVGGAASAAARPGAGAAPRRSRRSIGQRRDDNDDCGDYTRFYRHFGM
jgi:hypothetical protein